MAVDNRKPSRCEQGPEDTDKELMQRECTDENNPAKIETNKTETEDTGELARSFHVIMLRTILRAWTMAAGCIPEAGKACGTSQSPRVAQQFRPN